MLRTDNYKTKQKQKILEIIQKQDKEFTIKDLYNSLDGIGLTTIYRFVDSMLEKGELRKNIGKDNITYYQYLEKCSNHNHFYLKCDKCGNIIHIDCDCIEELSNHIFGEHKFKLDRNQIIINGICYKCEGGE